MKGGDSNSETIPQTGIVISAKNLSKRFQHEWIFKNLTTTFYAGNTYAVIGPNGSGKSTLLQVLWGQMPPNNGDLVFSKDEVNIPVEEFFRYTTIATPYMDLIEEFTLWEHLRFHFSLRKSRNQASLEEIMEKMELGHAKNKPISNFSSGMKQRLKLGLSFFTEADVIFLDEPGTNLDSQAFQWYEVNLKSLPSTSLIIIASNQPSEYPLTAYKIDILSLK